MFQFFVYNQISSVLKMYKSRVDRKMSMLKKLHFIFVRTSKFCVEARC